MSQAPQIDANALWQYVVQQIKQRVSLPHVWRAVEAARPIVVEGDLLILAYGTETAHQAGLLADNRYRIMIEQTLQAATHRPLRFRVINGETPADWEAVKAAEAEAVRLQAETKQQRQTRLDAANTWEAVGEGLIRKFGGLNNRGLASVQGRYLTEAVAALAEAYARLMPETPQETDERAYTRVLERISERTGVAAAMIGYLVDGHRARQ